MKLSIEYWSVWNYLPSAAGLASEILQKHGTDVKELTLLPSGGGVFEIILNDNVIFSKKKNNRFPNDGEVLKLIASN